jgi:hypothetical protein
MDRKTLMVILAFAILMIAGLMTAPAFSGEHPWDSDRPVPNHIPVTVHPNDTATTVIDSTGVVATSGGTTVATILRWHRIIRVAWSATMAM